MPDRVSAAQPPSPMQSHGLEGEQVQEILLKVTKAAMFEKNFKTHTVSG